jgi:hypothetical protein
MTFQHLRVSTKTSKGLEDHISLREATSLEINQNYFFSSNFVEKSTWTQAYNTYYM